MTFCNEYYYISFCSGSEMCVCSTQSLSGVLANPSRSISVLDGHILFLIVYFLAHIWKSNLPVTLKRMTAQCPLLGIRVWLINSLWYLLFPALPGYRSFYVENLPKRPLTCVNSHCRSFIHRWPRGRAALIGWS
jgi:hypothetical protein